MHLEFADIFLVVLMIAFAGWCLRILSKPADNAVHKNEDSESIFLAELIEKKSAWDRRARERAIDNMDNSRELEYAEAYKMLIHQYSHVIITTVKTEPEQ